MNELKERFLVDEAGARIAVLLDIEEYRRLTQALEELETIKAYDEAKASGDEAIPFGVATKEIESRQP